MTNGGNIYMHKPFLEAVKGQSQNKRAFEGAGQQGQAKRRHQGGQQGGQAGAGGAYSLWNTSTADEILDSARVTAHQAMMQALDADKVPKNVQQRWREHVNRFARAPWDFLPALSPAKVEMVKTMMGNGGDEPGLYPRPDTGKAVAICLNKIAGFMDDTASVINEKMWNVIPLSAIMTASSSLSLDLRRPASFTEVLQNYKDKGAHVYVVAVLGNGLHAQTMAGAMNAQRLMRSVWQVVLAHVALHVTCPVIIHEDSFRYTCANNALLHTQSGYGHIVHPLCRSVAVGECEETKGRWAALALEGIGHGKTTSIVDLTTRAPPIRTTEFIACAPDVTLHTWLREFPDDVVLGVPMTTIAATWHVVDTTDATTTERLLSRDIEIAEWVKEGHHAKDLPAARPLFVIPTTLIAAAPHQYLVISKSEKATAAGGGGGEGRTMADLRAAWGMFTALQTAVGEDNDLYALPVAKGKLWVVAAKAVVLKDKRWRIVGATEALTTQSTRPAAWRYGEAPQAPLTVSSGHITNVPMCTRTQARCLVARWLGIRPEDVIDVAFAGRMDGAGICARMEFVLQQGVRIPGVPRKTGDVGLGIMEITVKEHVFQRTERAGAGGAKPMETEGEDVETAWGNGAAASASGQDMGPVITHYAPATAVLPAAAVNGAKRLKEQMRTIERKPVERLQAAPIDAAAAALAPQVYTVDTRVAPKKLDGEVGKALGKETITAIGPTRYIMADGTATLSDDPRFARPEGVKKIATALCLPEQAKDTLMVALTGAPPAWLMEAAMKHGFHYVATAGTATVVVDGRDGVPYSTQVAPGIAVACKKGMKNVTFTIPQKSRGILCMPARAL